METLEALTQRVSVPKLTEPAPGPDQLELMYKAALRAPDHGRLRPWKFLQVEGSGALKALGEKLLSAALESEPEMNQDKQERILKQPLRAPLVIIAVASCTLNDKIPEIEQRLSVGAAIQNLQTAAFALGFASIWRTGALAYDRAVHAALGLLDHEYIVGFIYIGTPENDNLPAVPERPQEDYVMSWPGN